MFDIAHVRSTSLPATCSARRPIFGRTGRTGPATGDHERARALAEELRVLEVRPAGTAAAPDSEGFGESASAHFATAVFPAIFPEQR
jgi:hypothetical protein